MKRLFLVWFLTLAAVASAREKVILDTDMGGDVDDALALAYLLRSSECELLGVTVEAWGGNGPRQAEIVSAICRDSGREVPIAIGPGAGNVLGQRAPAHPPKPPRYWPIVKNRSHATFGPGADAVDFLRRTIRANPGEVTVVAVGHFTNLGALFAVEPQIPALLKRLVLMGGNLTGVGEWNAAYDPVATASVFANGNHARAPETLVVGGDVTYPYHLAKDEARKFLGGIPSLALCAEAAEYWLAEGHDLYFHDPIAAVVALQPELATWTNATVSVALPSGRTKFDSRPNPEHGVLRVATSVDFPRFSERFLTTMRGSKPAGRGAKVVPKMTPAAPGAVRPSGWLRDLACAIRDGYTAHMDEVDEQFRMAWAADTTPRGKDVHWWSNPGSWSCEGGAYWFDGLVRLAFQLDDPSLKTMISNRLETVLTRTSEKTFGFCWWMRPDCPQDVKDMQSDGFLLFNAEKLESTVGAWYEATGDPRAERALRLAFTQHVFDLMTEQRGAPLRGAVDAWRLTRDPALAARIDAACADKAAGGRLWTVYGRPPAKGLEETLNLKYRHERMLGIPSRHGIGAHSALARLLCAYRWTGNEELLKTVRAWYDFFGRHCRQPFGHTVMDEEWGHAGPTRATETCTAAIENATRLELLSTLGEGAWGDDIELSAFNLVPNCFSSDFRAHVYMQQPNRTRDNDLADCSHGGDPDPQGRPHTHGRYERKHYPLCCTAGLNRLLPDYVQSMWLKTRDGGVAAALYGPSTFETTLPGGRFAVREETAYPFEETVRLVVDAAPQKAVPLYIRLPKWCAEPSVCINGESVEFAGEKGFAKVLRSWRCGDVVTVRLPMKPVFHTMRDWNHYGRAYGWLTLGPILFSQSLPSADANTPTNPNAVVPTISAAGAERTEVTRLSSSVSWGRPDEPPVRLTLRTADGAPLELVPYGLSKFRFTMFPLENRR